MKIFSGKKIIYITEIIVFGFLIAAMIFSGLFTRKIIAAVLLLISLFCIKFLKNDINENIHSNQINLIVFLISVVYIMLLYVMGIYFGFCKSAVQLSLKSVKTFILPYIVIIVSSEIIRKSLYLKSNSSISKILVTISFILLDVILNTDIKDLEGLEDYVTVISFVIFSSIANNLLFNYIVSRFNSIKANIIYRIITNLYNFFIPIVPNIYVFFESIIRMLVPYVIFIFLEAIYNKKSVIKTSEVKRNEKIFITISAIIVSIIVMLVSCKFTYGVLVVGSGSMTGTINKGDIIVYKEYDGKDVNVGEILLFNKKNVKTIHRVINIKETSSGMNYYTKGDANMQQDEGYITKVDIIGRVIYKIPYIGYLNLWISDLFK